MVNWKTKYLAMKLKYINAKQNGGMWAKIAATKSDAEKAAEAKAQKDAERAAKKKAAEQAAKKKAAEQAAKKAAAPAPAPANSDTNLTIVPAPNMLELEDRSNESYIFHTNK